MMDHQLGRIDLIRWQGRRNNRGKPRFGVWTVIVAACAVVGVVGVAGQALGLLPSAGLLAMVPIGLVLLAISAQLAAMVRAALAWLGG